MSYFGIPLRNGVSLGLGTTPALSNPPLNYRLAPSLNLIFAGANTLSPAVTFSRTSNATLTGSDGLIQYAPNNLLTFSEQFDNAVWVKTRATTEANVITAPDGSLTADKLVASKDASTTHFIQNGATTTSAVHTFSTYIKAGGYNFAYLFNATVSLGAFFDLASIAVGTVSDGATASIVDVGNGWRRCTMTATATAASNGFRIYPAISTSSATLTGDGTSGIYIWGAQLNTGSLQPYNPTTTAAYYGPRFDYDPVTLAPKGLLIEEQRTNLLTYSEQFDTGAWAKTGMTASANAGVSPDGATTADRVVYNGAGTPAVSHIQNPASNAPGSNQTLTGSIWLKSFNGLNQSLRLKNTHGGVIDNFSSNLTITDQWQRFTLTVTNSASSGVSQIFGLSPATGNAAFDVLVWGAQLELGAFATSYIPTVASQVTRSADNASMTGTNFSSWYNASEGTLFTDADSVATTNTSITISDNTINNRLSLYARASGTVEWIAAIYTNNVRQTDSFANGTFGVVSKVSLAYKTNDMAASLNGSSATTDTSGIIPSVNRMFIGARYDGAAGFLCGHVKQITYYPRRLTNSELQAITS